MKGSGPIAVISLRSCEVEICLHKLTGGVLRVFVVEKGQFGRGQRWVWSEGVCFFREAFLEGGIVGIVFLPGVHERLEILEGKSVGSDKTLKSREFIMRAEVEEGGMEEVSVWRSSK
jgi:hypothetical protein